MMKSSRRKFGKLDQFTLIELLIVISIVAILAALLLPALNIARQMAYSARCTGNYRQIYIAAVNYADAYQVLPGRALSIGSYAYMYRAGFLPIQRASQTASNVITCTLYPESEYRISTSSVLNYSKTQYCWSSDIGYLNNDGTSIIHEFIKLHTIKRPSWCLLMAAGSKPWMDTSSAGVLGNGDLATVTFNSAPAYLERFHKLALRKVLNASGSVQEVGIPEFNKGYASSSGYKYSTMNPMK